MGPDPTPLSRPLPPLFKAEKGTLPFAALPDGKIRVTYSSWDDAKIVHPGQVLELRWGRQGVECRIGDPKALEAILFEKPATPFHCPSGRGCKSDVDCTDPRCLPFFAGKTSTITEPEQPKAEVNAVEVHVGIRTERPTVSTVVRARKVATDLDYALRLHEKGGEQQPIRLAFTFWEVAAAVAMLLDATTVDAPAPPAVSFATIPDDVFACLKDARIQLVGDLAEHNAQDEAVRVQTVGLATVMHPRTMAALNDFLGAVIDQRIEKFGLKIVT